MDNLIIFFGEYYIYCLALVFLFVVWKYYSSHQRDKLILMIVALGGAIFARYVIATGIRFFYHRPRPFMVLPIKHLLTDNAYSFPSGHTIFIFALATIIHSINKKLSYFLYISGLIIGLARIMGGVHWPSDVLGGIVLGLLMGYLVRLLINPKLGKLQN